MPEYGKSTNAELQALLKERGLPHSGKKAELVARLQEDDKKKESEGAAPSTEVKPKSATAEDEIDWEDDDAPASKTAAPTSEASKKAQESTAKSEPVAKVGQPSAPSVLADVSKEQDDDAPAASDEKPKEKTPVDFSIGLAKTTLDEEIEKRKARAKKFGVESTDPLAEEALKRLERAKKFGETEVPQGLNQALPDRRPKRGRDDGDERGDFKRRGGRGGRFGRGFGRGGNRRQGPSRENEQTNGAGGRSTGLSEKDRAAAEARKARFAN